MIFVLDFGPFVKFSSEVNMNNNGSASNLSQQSNNGLKALRTLLPVALAITLTNGLVLAMFYRRKSLRTKSNCLLLSLTICDFLTGAINIPYFIIFSFEVLESAMFNNFQYILHTLMAVSAGYHILIITAEKYMAITNPLRHYLVTKKTVLKTLAGIWITSTLIAIIPVAWNESNSRLLWYSIHAAVCLLVVFFIPYVFMIYAFTIMFRVITNRGRPSLTHISHKSRLQLQRNINDRKCILVFALMAAIFVFCWLPYFTMMLIININDYVKTDTSISIRKATEAVVIIRYMASITNPLLYTYFKRDFWLEIRNFLSTGGFSLPASKRKSRSLALYLRKRPKSVDNISRLSLSCEVITYNIEYDTSSNSKEEMVFISSV